MEKEFKDLIITERFTTDVQKEHQISNDVFMKIVSYGPYTYEYNAVNLITGTLWHFAGYDKVKTV